MKKNKVDSKVWWPARRHPGKQTKVIRLPNGPADPSKAEVLWVDDEGEPVELKDVGSRVLSVIARVIEYTAKAAYHLRGLLISIPVAIIALKLAAENSALLPEIVHFEAAGVDAAKNLVFETYTVTRQVAVMAPLTLTFASLLMVVLSRRIVYPWVISVFTLLLPYILQIINTFP